MNLTMQIIYGDIHLGREFTLLEILEKYLKSINNQR
jgi:hypothetical protein